MNEKNGEAQTKKFSMNMKLAKQKILRKKNRCEYNGYSYVIYDSLLYYFKN